jgi:sulfur carrier protein ThiS
MPSEKLEDLLKDVDLTESTMIVAKEITDWFVDMVSSPN